MTSYLLLLTILQTGSPGLENNPEKGVDFFERKIRPVLVEQCYSCHSDQAKKLRSGLRLDLKAGMLRGGDSGHPAVVPGNPDKSKILAALKYKGPEMPPKQKLSDEVIENFEKWISMGAPDPRTKKLEAKLSKKPDGKDHWAFQAIQDPPLPSVRLKPWPKSDLDHFILARLEKEGIKPSKEADRRTLIRRVTSVLTGLLPTPEEVEAFVNDPSEKAYEVLVDKLLSSPRYGEHITRLWLDLSRYAEDQAHIVGNNKSLFFPNAYIYRDWVIEALNRDLPYDRFLRLQLAVDLIEPDNKKDLAALGFMGLGPKYYNRNNPVVKADEWEDRIDTLSRGLLGLTVACARCHDHKFDPITSKDYYALAGVYASVKMYNRPLETDSKTDKSKSKSPGGAMHIIQEGRPTDLKVYIRGDHKNLGELAKRRFLSILGGSEEKAFTKGSGRQELAEAILDPKNPLTSRVIVNRLWAWAFGKPIVGTPSNFGVLGEKPSHPELLDHLATKFQKNGWSFKKFLRELVLSKTFKQSNQTEKSYVELDPENRWLGRAHLRRRSIETWRDSILMVSRGLEEKLGGPSVEIDNPQSRRRTIYAKVSRFQLNKLLALYDFPDPNIHAARRVETTTPLQKLFSLNSPFMVEQAKALANKLKEKATAESYVQAIYQHLFQRKPVPAELKLGIEYLSQKSGDTKRDFRVEYAHALLASNEMLYLD